jgi:hypothetical protein
MLEVNLNAVSPEEITGLVRLTEARSGAVLGTFRGQGNAQWWMSSLRRPRLLALLGYCAVEGQSGARPGHGTTGTYGPRAVQG